MVKSESSLPCGKSEIISITNTSSTSGDDKIRSTHVRHPTPFQLQELGKFGNQNPSCTISMGNERGGGHKCTSFNCHLILGFTLCWKWSYFFHEGDQIKKLMFSSCQYCGNQNDRSILILSLIACFLIAIT